MPRASVDRGDAPPGGARSGRPRWLWPAAVAVASAGAAISGYLTVAAFSGAPPVCLAGDCAAVAASPYARFLGVPTATWGLALYVAVGSLSAALAWARFPAPAFSWVPLAVLGLTAFGAAFSLYLLWVQVAVLHAVCSWCAASDVLWIVLLALILAAVLRSD